MTSERNIFCRYLASTCIIIIVFSVLVLCTVFFYEYNSFDNSHDAFDDYNDDELPVCNFLRESSDPASKVVCVEDADQVEKEMVDAAIERSLVTISDFTADSK